MIYTWKTVFDQIVFFEILIQDALQTFKDLVTAYFPRYKLTLIESFRIIEQHLQLGNNNTLA